MPSLVIEKPGILTTVRDLGRPGLGRLGIAPSGAVDALALRAANRLVGNEEGAPALELTGAGAALRFEGPGLVALGGGDLGAELDGTPLPSWRAQAVAAGSRLVFNTRRRGARTVLAMAGGLEGDGRALVAGSALAVGPRRGVASPVGPVTRAYDEPFVLRFVVDEEGGAPEASRLLPLRRWRIDQRSSRAGLRFDGEPLPAPARAEALSEPLAPRTIQVPPDGLPILLLADRGTVGGYARAGALIRADEPKAAQLWIGDEVRFVPVDPATARAALLEQEGWLYPISAAES